MNMRKIIAVLVAALMLCSIIPMGALVSAAALVDYDFEDGSLGSWKYDTANDTLEVVDGAMKWTTVSWKNTYLNFKATANTDYKLTIRAKADANATVDVKFLNGSWGTSGIEKTSPTFGTDWTEHTYIFNSLEYGGLVLLFQSHKATTIYIDSVKIEEYVVPKDPEFPENAIYTETFENSSLNGWTSNCSVASTAGLAATKADGGNYCLEFISPNYSYTNYKLTVEKNTDYKVIFSVLSATSGYPLNARVRDGSGDLGYVSYTPSTTAWETHSYTFNSGNNTSVNLRFQAGWSTGTYYLDNICVVPFDRSTMTNDGHVLNGDWETGDATEWANSPNVEVVADPTGAGQGYVIKTFETSSSAVDMFVQEFKNLEVGKEYTLSFKVYGYGTATNNAFFVRFPKAFTTWSVNSTLASAKNNDYTPRINVNAMTNAWYDVNITFIAQAATAKVQFMNYRSGQGFYYFDDIALSHAYGAGVVTDPTCENGGYTTYTCACGASYTDSKTAALGHNYNEGICGTCGAEDPNYTPACEHEFFSDCDTVCMICYEEVREASHHVIHVDAKDATCTENGNIEYWCCDVCGMAWLDADCIMNTNRFAVILPAGHSYEYECSTTCYVCWEETNPDAQHQYTYYPAVEAIDCQNPGNIEHYRCDYCRECTDANGNGIPSWNISITIDCVRPEGTADCATIDCEICGKEISGYGEHDVLACQGGTCSKCGDEIEGYGCANYDTPACMNGFCYYCGGFVAGFGHENGAWSDCCEGECAYGCGLKYPAAEDHIDEDGNGYCDNCWSHNHVLPDNFDPCFGGECEDCWTFVDGAHTYADDKATECTVCGDIRVIEYETITFGGSSVSEDCDGLAFKFDISEYVNIEIQDGRVYRADYSDASIAFDSTGEYKLVKMGAVVTNGNCNPTLDNLSANVVDIPAKNLIITEDESAFAVRVINIPDSGKDTIIIARSYFIYEDAEGEQFVVYGDVIANSYNAAMAAIAE